DACVEMLNQMAVIEHFRYGSRVFQRKLARPCYRAYLKTCRHGVLEHPTDGPRDLRVSVFLKPALPGLRPGCDRCAAHRSTCASQNSGRRRERCREVEKHEPGWQRGIGARMQRGQERTSSIGTW